MRRNELGDYVALCWKWLAQHYAYVELDEWIVMPNHLHGILVITNGRGGSRTARQPSFVGALREAPLQGIDMNVPTKRKPLGRLVGEFKTASTDWYNQQRGTPGAPLWQRDFYDHIIRNEDELNKIREYIRTNPLRWGSDPENM